MNIWIVGIVLGFVMQGACVVGYLMNTKVVEIQKERIVQVMDMKGAIISSEMFPPNFDRFEIREKMAGK